MNVEAWLLAMLRHLEARVPEAWQTRLKHLVRCLAGWVDLPFAALYYAYSWLRCWSDGDAAHSSSYLTGLDR